MLLSARLIGYHVSHGHRLLGVKLSRDAVPVVYHDHARAVLQGFLDLLRMRNNIRRKKQANQLEKTNQTGKASTMLNLFVKAMDKAVAGLGE